MQEPRESPPALPLEVVPPELPARPVPSGERIPDRGSPAFHPWSALLLLVVDNLWNLAEFAVIDLPITVPLCFLCVFAGTFLVQRRRNQDSVGRALAKALFLGVVAAVPFSVTGTPVGLALLAWAGIRHPLKRDV
jgi:hypothetical protein